MQQPQQGAREVMWVRDDLPGMEHLRLVWRERNLAGNASDATTGADDIAIYASGLILGVDEHRAPQGQRQSFRLEYQCACDSQWRVRTIRFIPRVAGRAQMQALGSDGEGHWFDNDGKELPTLDGCSDIDISATPFTNTLPIRRLALQPGDSAEITVVYVDVPSLDLSVSRQRYERLAESAAGAVYRFTALASGFTADLTVDDDGLVLDYPGLFHRVWPA